MSSLAYFIGKKIKLSKSTIMKFILIIVPVIAFIILILSYLNVLISRYIPFVCYLVIFSSLAITLILKKKKIV